VIDIAGLRLAVPPWYWLISGRFRGSSRPRISRRPQTLDFAAQEIRLEKRRITADTGMKLQNGTEKLGSNLSQRQSSFASDRECREFSTREPEQEMAQILHCQTRVHFLSDPSPTTSEGEGAYSLKGTDRSYLPLRGKLDG
jgi:hypothetical protein